MSDALRQSTSSSSCWLVAFISEEDKERNLLDSQFTSTTLNNKQQTHLTTFNMSDALRQSTTDKAASSLKPDSQKSGLEQAGDSIKGAADNVAGSAQPSGEKSATQKVSDSVSGTNDNASKQGQSVLDSASETVGNAAQSAQDALGLGKK